MQTSLSFGTDRTAGSGSGSRSPGRWPTRPSFSVRGRAYRRWSSWLARVEVLGEALPAAEVLVLQLGRFDGVRGRPPHQAGLEHEGHRVLDDIGLREVGAARALEGFGVGP